MPEHLEQLEQAKTRRRPAMASPEREQVGRAPRGPGREGLGAADVLGLQQSVGNAGTAAFLQREGEPGTASGRSPVHDVVGSGGSPLDPGTRAAMESRLGGSFGDVRPHMDARSTESVQAAAFTVGRDIVVHPDHFSPGTPQAQRTLAHELTHVKQQASGPVEGSPWSGGIRVSDPSDRFEQEAERSADAAMSAVQRQPGDALATDDGSAAGQRASGGPIEGDDFG